MLGVPFFGLLPKLAQTSCLPIRDPVQLPAAALWSSYMDSVALDKIVDKIVALGVPGLVLVVAMAVTGYAGAGALTTALAVLGGPMGMLGGIGLLGLLALISKSLSDFGFTTLFKMVLKRLMGEGHSIEEIRKTVDGYWSISAMLKMELKRHLDLWGSQDRLD